MAASNWGTDCRLDDSLFLSAYEFDFFQAVRLLTLLDAERHGERHSGESTDFNNVVRFCAHNSLAFPASAIASIEKKNGDPPSMAVTFMGMIGPRGVLPTAYTEIAIDRESFGDRSFADFLDIFNHRLIQLFFEAWKKHQFVIGYEQSQQRDRLDTFTSYLFDLVGMGTSGLQNRMPVPDIGLLHYAGLLAQRPHSADALRSLLHHYFEVPASVEQFCGKWHALETDELCSLGSDEAASELGGGAVAGDAVWSRQALVRIVLGPLTADEFHRFLPNGKDFFKIAALVRWFLGSSLEFEIQPTLARDEVPPCRLGDETCDGSRLGWSAWLRTEPFWFPATDAIFREEELVRLEA
jgi:type VI secretion system protein ImpH